jgi:hypothetical protein
MGCEIGWENSTKESGPRRASVLHFIPKKIVIARPARVRATQFGSK